MQKKLFILCSTLYTITNIHASQSQIAQHAVHFEISSYPNFLLYKLQRATSYGHYELAAAARKKKATHASAFKKAKIQLREPLESARRFQQYQDGKLIESAKRDDEEYMEILLNRHGPQVDAQDQHGRTALHIAARKGSMACVTLLLHHHADTNVLDNQKFTPLMYAMINKHHDLVSILISKGGEIRSNANFTAQLINSIEKNFICEDVDTTSDEETSEEEISMTSLPASDEDVIYFRRAPTSSSEDEEDC